MESKNSYLNIDLDNPFTDLDFDSQTTGWRRYWNINDNPEVQYNKKHRKKYFENVLALSILMIMFYHGRKENAFPWPINQNQSSQINEE